MQSSTNDDRDIDADNCRTTCYPIENSNVDRDRRSVAHALHRGALSEILQTTTPTSLLFKSKIHATGIPVVHELARGVPGFWGPPASEVADLYAVLMAVES
jgi:hypothetical protein